MSNLNIISIIGRKLSHIRHIFTDNLTALRRDWLAALAGLLLVLLAGLLIRFGSASFWGNS